MLGICNGFQVLCEAHLLPGALLPNANLRFTFRQVELDVVRPDTAFTQRVRGGERLSIPAKHSWGRYYADEQTLRRDGASPARWSCATRPDTTSTARCGDIAGVRNEAGNVFGLMPHPEHAVEELTGGSTDGLRIFESMRLAAEGALAGGGSRG